MPKETLGATQHTAANGKSIPIAFCQPGIYLSPAGHSSFSLVLSASASPQLRLLSHPESSLLVPCFYSPSASSSSLDQLCVSGVCPSLQSTKAAVCLGTSLVRGAMFSSPETSCSDSPANVWHTEILSSCGCLFYRKAITHHLPQGLHFFLTTGK